MHGSSPTLQDIVLSEQPTEVQPDEVDLRCYEELLPEEVLDQPEPDVDPYRVLVPCGKCERIIKLAILATSCGVVTLEQLLLGELQIVCPPCAVRLRF